MVDVFNGMRIHSSSRNRSKWKSVKMGKLRCYSISNRFACVTASLLLLWCWVFLLFSGNSTGKQFYSSVAADAGIFSDSKGSVPVVHLVLPILLCVSICTLFLVDTSQNVASSSRGYISLKLLKSPYSAEFQFNRWLTKMRGGDINILRFIIIFVLVPSMIYVLSVIKRHLSGSNNMGQLEMISEGANAFAMMAEVNMAFFLIPVSKGYNPLLRLFGLSPILATQIHIWAGRIGAVGVIVHGIGHILKWHIDDSEDSTNIYNSIVPSKYCWQNFGKNDKECYPVFRNFTGTVSMICFIGILLSSLNFVRRRYYRLFYRFHIILGPVVIISACMHHPRIVLYLSPGILYYLSSSVPSYIKVSSTRYYAKGINLISSRTIPYSGGCVELSFECDPFLAQKHVAQYVRICVPQISFMDFHPFTIIPSYRNPSAMNVIFRPTGNFTNKLSRTLALADRSKVDFLLDGVYFGPNRVEQALQHDDVYMVAGGIGITPFISFILVLFRLFHQHLSNDNKIILPVQRLTLHWICRDEGLIQHIIKHYFSSICNDELEFFPNFPKFRVIVHHTDSNLHSNESRVPVMAAFDFEDNEMISSQVIDANGDLPDIPISSKTRKGAKFQPSYSSSPALSISGNITTFVACSCIAWVGLWIIWSQYINDILKNKYDVVVRIWGILAAYVTSYAIALLMESFLNVIPIYAKFKETNSDGVEIQLREMNAIPVRSIDDNEGLHRSIDRKLVQIEHSRGRPDIRSIFSDISSADCPGLFLCGPSTLTKAAKEICIESGACASKKKCAIYEESFTI